MAARLGHYVRNFIFLAGFVLVAACSTTGPSGAAPYAAYVMDARTGETLYTKNADTRLHPASLTKMLTLYIAFGAIESGEISLDSIVTISKNAASEPPSRLGLKAGQKIALRHLIRAAAVKSANDAATAIGEAVSGSEAKFAARMNATAQAIGMKNSTFKNANGLTTKGHLSTARDMSVLGRRLFYDFPQYYNLFSRRSTDAGLAEVNNTNRRFLDAYEGSDGIKTGFTQAAGFNLTASAQRGSTRIVASVFGGTSTAHRNAKMKELLDLGFSKAPANAPVAPSAPAVTPVPDAALVATAEMPDGNGEITLGGNGQNVAAGKTIRVAGTVADSPRPKGRPVAGETQQAAAPTVNAADAAMAEGIAAALVEASDTDLAVAEALGLSPADLAGETQVAANDMPANIETLSAAAVVKPEKKPTIIHTATPAEPPAELIVASAEAEVVPTAAEVVTRISTSGGRHWGVNVGKYASRSEAERVLMKLALAESATLNDGLRKIIQRSAGFDANFMGLSQDQADLACRRLQARGAMCFTIGP